MLYSEIKRTVLSHINQYTMAGTPVAASYNNQADYLNRIPLFVNEGLVNIRTLVKPDAVVLPLLEGEEYGGMMRYKLPEDFWSLKSGGISVLRDGRFKKTNTYKLQGKDYILTPKCEDASYTVEYYKYPEQLPLDCADNYELVEDPEVIHTACYYAAANLLRLEDEFAYATLYNDYESRLGRISPGIRMEVAPVEDVYAFAANWGCGL